MRQRRAASYTQGSVTNTDDLRVRTDGQRQCRPTGAATSSTQRHQHKVVNTSPSQRRAALRTKALGRSFVRKRIQVGRETYAVTSQPGTSYTFDTRIDTATCGARVGRETIALPQIGTFQIQRPQPVTNPAEHTNQEVPKRKSTKPQKPHRHRHSLYKTQGRAIDTFSSASRP